MRLTIWATATRLMSVNVPKILVTDSTVKVPKLREIGDVFQFGPGHMPRELLLERVVEVEAIFCLVRDKIDKELIEKAKNLKMIGTMSVGYEHIDIEECKRRNIRIGYTPDVLTETVAELGMALLLTTARRLPEAINSVKTGGWKAWSPYYMCGKSLAYSVIGIYGMGKIGSSLAAKLEPFKPMQIIYNNRREKEGTPHTFVSFDELLAQSDFLIISASPSLDNTRIFNKSAFAKMKKQAVLINISRGILVDHTDLTEALSDGVISAAGLDVTDPEPFPVDHPLVKMDNCVILPHIGSATYGTRDAMVDTTEQNICNYFAGKSMISELEL